MKSSKPRGQYNKQSSTVKNVNQRLKNDELKKREGGTLAQKITENQALIEISARLKSPCLCSKLRSNTCSSCPWKIRCIEIPTKKRREPMKPALDQGRPKKRKEKKSRRKEEAHHDDLEQKDSESASFVSEDGSSEAESFYEALQDSIDSLDLRAASYKGECHKCQCLLTAFHDESISTAAAYYKYVRDLYAGKAKDEVDEIKYSLWEQTATLEVTISAAEEEKMKLKDHTYTLPDEYGSGVLCGENWLWLHGISLRKAKGFSEKLKDAICAPGDVHARFNMLKSSTQKFSDASKIDMPYKDVKAIFDETLNDGGTKIVLIFSFSFSFNDQLLRVCCGGNKMRTRKEKRRSPAYHDMV